MKIATAALQVAKIHAEEGYPHEICGFLIGARGSGRISRAVRATNTVEVRSRDRYEIDPRDIIRVQRAADDAGEDVLGYYHSHPDHPARASVFDAERSWAGPLYLIVSCVGGKVVDANAFIAREDGGPFREEPIDLF
ncbi:MAG: M67 family metallopeptidase [Candidatus Dormibacteraeota bacterium]|nr:M67 family metallopeptidase [Candidatus Dormibacteraeota bacterium]